MSDPIIDSIAAALAGQAVTALSTAGKKAVSKIRDMIRGRPEEDPETLAALDAAEGASAGQPEITALAQRLDERAAEDAQFNEELRTQGTTVHNEVHNKVDNKFYGNADKVIQAGEIHGGIQM